MKDITENEVLQAMQDAMGEPDEGEAGVLPKEAMEALKGAGHNINIHGVRQLFVKLIESGAAVIVTVKRPRWNGTLTSHQGIQFLKNGK